MNSLAETISPEEVADRLGVKKATVMQWARERAIGSVIIGRKRRFTEKHVADYIRQHEIPANVMAASQRSRAYHSRNK